MQGKHWVNFEASFSTFNHLRVTKKIEFDRVNPSDQNSARHYSAPLQTNNTVNG